MKYRLYVLAAVMAMLSSPVFSASYCHLEVHYGFAGKNLELPVVKSGKTQTHFRSDVRRVYNKGSKDVEILVQGGWAKSAWHRINVKENYIGFVDLKKIRCLESDDGARDPIEQLADRVQTEAEMIGETGQAAVKDVQKRVEKSLGIVNDMAAEFLYDISAQQWRSVGRAVLCDSYLGNQDNQRILNLAQLQFRGARGNANKFANLEVTSDFSAMNNYLLMQASNKTYYHQVKHGFDAEKRIWNKANTEREFRCATQELYRYWGFDDVLFVNGALGANAVIGIDDEKIVIAVRGTQNPGEFTKVADLEDNQSGPLNFTELNDESSKGAMDVLINMSHYKLPALGLAIADAGEVHGGYAMAAMELHGLIDVVEPFLELKEKPMFITGHSLGGATATVLAKRMKHGGYDVSAAYVYAPPKVGDASFVRELRQHLDLHVTWNYRDPVPTFLNSEMLKIGDFSLTGINKFRFTWEGADTFTFFDHAHTAHTYEPDGSNHKTIYLDIREKQGAPYPEVLFRNGPMSDEWFFHNGNFYTAFTYNEVMRQGLSAENGSAIQPEFIKEPMCLFWSDSFTKHRYDWNASYRRFTGDKQAYPMQQCMW